MKLLGYVSCALIASLIVGQSAFAAPADGNETRQPVKSEPKDALAEASSSREAMLESMADPIANKAFHDLQLQVLQTPSDAMVYQYFAKSPIFAKLYQFLVRHNDSLLLGFEMQAKSQMVQAVRGLTPQYDLIDKLVVEVASSLGFTKEAIANRQIYLLGGEENAFTVSGSQNKIIVAFQRGILRTMTRSEIAGVLAHELGHIRGEHTVKGIMNAIMMEIVGELFVNGRITVSPQDANMNNRLHSEHNRSLLLQDIQCFGCSLHGSTKKIQNIEKILASVEATLQGRFMMAPENQDFGIKLGAASNPKLKMIDQQIQEFVIQFASMDKAQLQQAVGSYLQLMIRVAQAEKAPPQTINYFAALLNQVPYIGAARMNVQEYMTHAKMAEYAISRAKETTADQVSAASVRNQHLASSFSKLLGLDFEKEYRPQIFDQIRKQADELLKNTPPELLSSFVGTTHPSLVLRINNVLNTPAYPSVLFANNYLRLMLLNDALLNSEARAKAYLQSFEEQVKANTEQVEAKIKQVLADATPEELEQARKDAAEVRAANQKAADEARAQILPQIAAITKSQQNHEARIFKLLFESEFRADANRAPRLENTIQYFSIQREVMFNTAEAMKQRMEQIIGMKVVDPRQLQSLEMEFRGLQVAHQSVLKNLELQKGFIERLKSRLSKVTLDPKNPSADMNLKKRFVLLNRIIEATNTQELEKIRARVTNVNTHLREQENYRSNKIPLKMSERLTFAPGFKEANSCSKLFH